MLGGACARCQRVDLLAARPLGTCWRAAVDRTVGGQKGRGPLERGAPCQSALSEYHWEELGGLRTIDFRQLPSHYPTRRVLNAVSVSRVRVFLIHLPGLVDTYTCWCGQGWTLHSQVFSLVTWHLSLSV